MLKGTFTALVTPFNSENQVNFEALKKLVDFQVREGITGLVPCGTTGESPTLSKQEKQDIIEHVINQVDGKVPVIAGTGNYDTKTTIESTDWAWRKGAAAALLITPYYNKPTQQGLYLHYKAISEAVPEIELVIYNVPSRTNVNILPKTVERLVKECPNLNTIKEASGDLNQVLELKRLCGNQLSILSGEDALIWPYIAAGANGVISVVSNIAVQLTSQIVNDGLKGNVENALAAQLKLQSLIHALFCETNPIPVKYAMNLLGFEVGNLRLPLHELSEQHRNHLKETLIEAGLMQYA
ncbi:MAG: 4-hydroxy-tetrahydrodipicolinate synthase [Calditrichaeota bacterium]|nr:4-hydroxy-tetrahydrodipicolinate synthase [Calditrichota bacterium]